MHNAKCAMRNARGTMQNVKCTMNKAFCIWHYAFCIGRNACGIGHCAFLMALFGVAVQTSGCGPKSQTIPSTSPAQTSSAAAPADRQSMRAVSLPGLSRVADSVRRQVRERYSALKVRLDAPGTTTVELGNTFGEVGMLLIAAEYFDAAEP